MITRSEPTYIPHCDPCRLRSDAQTGHYVRPALLSPPPAPSLSANWPYSARSGQNRQRASVWSHMLEYMTLDRFLDLDAGRSLVLKQRFVACGPWRPSAGASLCTRGPWSSVFARQRPVATPGSRLSRHPPARKDPGLAKTRPRQTMRTRRNGHPVPPGASRLTKRDRSANRA